MSVNVYDPINDKLIPVAGATLYADVGIGFIAPFGGKPSNLPDGWLEFKGQNNLLRSDYPDLWAFAVANEQVGVNKLFKNGDGSTTFGLADLRETGLTGYGVTERDDVTIGAHRTGLGVGEFIDDRLQNHEHEGKTTEGTGGANVSKIIGTSGHPYSSSGEVFNARTGTTTEVKAVGVVWAVKARMTGLPIDLKEQVDQVEEISGTTNGITYHVRKNNSVVCIDFFGKPSTASSNPEFILTELPSNLRPKSIIANVTLNSLTDTVVGSLYASPSGRLYMYLSGGGVWDTSVNYGGSLTYIV